MVINLNKKDKRKNKLYGGIEGGGTKFVCGIGNENGDIIESVSIKTTTPEETVMQIQELYKIGWKKYDLKKIGIGCFGPLDLDKGSKTFGYITSTPKSGWQFFNLRESLNKALEKKIVLDTDVNAAALGEYFWGNGKGYNDFVYITIGTGIGAGIMSNGKLIHGLMHPEVGHILIPDEKILEGFDGVCPYHKRCLEGLASGPAIKTFWKENIENLPLTHPAWEAESSILAYGLVNIILTVSPKRIILGGGVMEQKNLFNKIRNKTASLLNGYIQKDEVSKSINDFIVPAGLGKNAGLLGAIALAIID
jgi:fructokinase